MLTQATGGQLSEQVLDEVGRIGVPFAVPGEVPGEREVRGTVGEREEQGREPLRVARRWPASLVRRSRRRSWPGAR